MTRTSGGELILLDQEIEKTLKKQRKEKKSKMEQEKQTQMNPRTLRSYAIPTLDGLHQALGDPMCKQTTLRSSLQLFRRSR